MISSTVTEGPRRLERAAAEEKDIWRAFVMDAGEATFVRMSTITVMLPATTVIRTSSAATPAAWAILDAISFFLSSVKSLTAPAMTKDVVTTWTEAYSPGDLGGGAT